MKKHKVADFQFGNPPAIGNSDSVEFYHRVAVVVESYKFLLIEVEYLTTMAHQKFGMPSSIGIVDLSQQIGVLEDVAEQQLAKEN